MDYSLVPRIETISDKKLVGMSKKMSMLTDKTGELFRTFMPRKKEFSQLKNTNVLDLRVYEDDYFSTFNPANIFIKWALVEPEEIATIPDNMEVFSLAGGTYAVFDYKGLSNDKGVFEYIFTQWLPKADYILDNRPHFEVLGEKTKLNDPNSEEEIWIPITQKK